MDGTLSNSIGLCEKYETAKGIAKKKKSKDDELKEASRVFGIEISED